MYRFKVIFNCWCVLEFYESQSFDGLYPKTL